jgi:toxin ParE1/3/4
MRKLVYRPRAQSDLAAIARYTKAEWGEEQARYYLTDIRQTIERAAQFPGIGSEGFGLPAGYRKLRTGAHRVIFRYSDTALVVVRILHQREDVPDDWHDLE